MALVIGKEYYIKNISSGKYLNVYGSDTVSNSRNVNVYTKEDCKAQKWVVRLAGNGARVLTTINEAYSLNIYTQSNNNCTMYAVAQNTEADSVVDFLTVDATQNLYKIKMIAHNRYLCLYDLASANVFWTSTLADPYTLWQLEEVNPTPVVPVTTVPTAIKDQTFFVKNFNTGSFLNVHGTNTIADDRNVNVYNFENVIAQQWVARQTSAGGKLFSKINEAFALNIYRPDNNCTVYTANNNDPDSVLEFEPYDSAQKIYRIRLSRSNQYLSVLSVDSGTNASWVEGPFVGYNLWKFETEEQAKPKPPAIPATLLNKPFYIKNMSNNLYLNVYGNDTVANARNVTVYEAEDVLAQKWVVKETADGGQLFTKINEAFALNIHEEANNNCTMYTAQNNARDSVLEISSANVSQNEYMIKLFNHKKYLSAVGDDRGANVRWTDMDEKIDIWKFIPVSEMDFTPVEPGGTFTKDSSLVTKVIPADSSNYTANRSAENARIEKITIHHMAGNMSIDTLGSLWQRPDRNGSSHYGVNGTQVGQYVKESDIAWTDGNWDSNKRSVTIETANSTLAPNWEIGTATYNTLVKLVADIARRNNLVPLKLPVQNAQGKWVEEEGTNLTWHSMYSATACPGPDLLRLMDSIVSEANAINSARDYKIYLRKQGTNEFLGIVGDAVGYVSKAQAKAFKLQPSVDRFTLCDFDNQSLRLQMRESDNKPVLSSSTEGNKVAYAEYNDNGTLNIYYEDATVRSMSSPIDTKFGIYKNYLCGLFNSVDFSSGKKDDLDSLENINLGPSSTPIGNVPLEYVEKVVRIKHKLTEKFLTYDGTAHPQTPGEKVTAQYAINNTSQLWKIVKIENRKFCLQPFENPYKSMAMIDVFSNCAVYENIDFPRDNSVVDISAVENGYAIKYTLQGKYLSLHSATGGPFLVGSSDIDDLWEIEVDTEPVLVDGWVRLYRNPYRNENDSRKVLIPSSDPNRPSDVPYAEPYTGPDGLYYVITIGILSNPK